MQRLALALLATVVVAETPCGHKRPDTLPDPEPGTCTDVGKCCDWTWPPPLTKIDSCDPTKKDEGCFGCKPPGCCCQGGLMVLTESGSTNVTSCCDYFYSDGL